MLNTLRKIHTAITLRLMDVHQDDRGEIPSNVAWVGGMVVLAVAVVGILSGKAQDFANNINFGP